MTNGHDEKFDEKDMEKREEKSPEEKHWEEKSRRDPLSGFIWALILIWAGVVFLASNMGWLDSFLRRSSDIPGMSFLNRLVGAWPIVLVGAGVIILGEVIVRLLVPAYRQPVFGTTIFAVILIALGLGEIVDWNLVWPIILIALGLSIVMRGMQRKR
jgi:hypothetical protein